MDAVFHCDAYLKEKCNSCLVLDLTHPVTDESVFKKCDWKNFYCDISEDIPKDEPQARGKVVDVRMYVDSDHADDKLTR